MYAVEVRDAIKMGVELDCPLRDTDRMDEWADNISFNPDARVAHDLAMVGHNESLARGVREFSCDAAGTAGGFRPVVETPDSPF